MNYGYARVSSVKQFTEGNGLEEQVKELKANGCDVIYQEQCTGTTMKRPELQKLLSELKSGDTLTITKLDRFARTVSEGLKSIKELIDRGITVNVLNLGFLKTDSTGSLMLGILMVFAEFERNMIIERTQAGKAIARTKAGYREGRPPIKETIIHEALEMLDRGQTYKEVVEKMRISKSTLIRAKNKRKAERIL